MTTLTLTTARPRGTALMLVVGFAGAVALRVAFAGPAGPASLPAGLLFAGILAVLCCTAPAAAVLTRRSAVLGLVGTAVFVLPALLARGVSDSHPAGDVGGYLGWAAATAVVATAEEAFLRGALFGAVQRWRGADAAVVVAAVAFALLHVPLYGWHVLPLDLAVGLGLGALRLASGGWAAPAVAHVGADLVGWWLV